MADAVPIRQGRKAPYEDALGIEGQLGPSMSGTLMSAAMASGDVQIIGQPGRAALRGGHLCRPGSADRSTSRSTMPTTTTAWSSARSSKSTKDQCQGTGRQEGVACPSAPPLITASSSQMEHFGVDVSTMDVVDMAPPDGAAAFAQGSSRHGLRLGRLAAPHAGARQRAADRRGEGPTSASWSST
jgi:taurine transport system substrate-binding protein